MTEGLGHRSTAEIALTLLHAKVKEQGWQITLKRKGSGGRKYTVRLTPPRGHSRKNSRAFTGRNPAEVVWRAYGWWTNQLDKEC